MYPQSFTTLNPMHIGQHFAPKLSATAPVSYDFSGLGKLAGDAGFVREIQQLFIDRVPGQLAQLATAIESEDWSSITYLAHSLKSSFGNLRIEPGTALLKEIESLAFQRRDTLELLAIARQVTGAAKAVSAIFQQELSLVA